MLYRWINAKTGTFYEEIWERDLGSTVDEDTSNNGLYIREARIQNV